VPGLCPRIGSGLDAAGTFERARLPARPLAARPDTFSGVTRLYTVEEARAVLAGLRPVLDEVVALRADAAELAAAVQGGEPSPLGGLPELKAAQARLDEVLSSIGAGNDLQLKGVAPLLLDFPAELDGVPVLLCWLEGDPDLAWYHRVDLGFLGRRRLPPDLLGGG
jgi:hypothetical protein